MNLLFRLWPLLLLCGGGVGGHRRRRCRHRCVLLVFAGAVVFMFLFCLVLWGVLLLLVLLLAGGYPLLLMLALSLSWFLFPDFMILAAVIQCEFLLWLAYCIFVSCISSFSSLILSVIEIMGSNYRHWSSFLIILEPKYCSWWQRGGKTFNTTDRTDDL